VKFGARLALFVIALLAACAQGLPEPTAAHVAAAQKTAPEATLSDLTRGRSRYQAKCGSCHALRDPTQAPAAGWQHEIEEMRSRQGVVLSAGEARDILLYLDSVSRVAQR
jgi:mono/diheme cytochrome c family protein